MSFNTFGHVLRFTTFGESHGVAIGCVVDGVPPRLPMDEAYIQDFLDKRRPGQSRYTTQRQEPDTVKILSGVFEEVTTGTPIGLLIENVDQRSKDYGDVAKAYRPGHADFTYDKKYGIRDYRGGGRSSARETAMRVAAGAVARRVLGQGITIRGALVQMGEVTIDRANWDWDEVHRNPFFCPDAEAAGAMAEKLDAARKNGGSLGAILEVVASGVPAGWGAPVYAKLDADIAAAIMGINAVKAVEIGAGFAAAALDGVDNADEIRLDAQGKPIFLSNNAGGILGGISSGQDIVVRLAIKPTSSILTPRKTITNDNTETEMFTKGRHDPCVGIRAVPVAEAMLALVLADHKLLHRAQCGEGERP
jgi:chorismate synthase